MPFFYPPRGALPYTLVGFHRSVRRRLRMRGFKECEIARIEKLYFGIKLKEHIDETGCYRNLRQFRLYKMSRKLKADRKRPIFELALRSGLFECFLDDDGKVVGIVSPYCVRVLGVVCFDF